MGALAFFWKQDEVDEWAKRHIYSACVLTVLLWGSETWATTDTILAKMNAFHHSCIRRILRIKMNRVKEERINNETVRKSFGNISSITELIKMRKLKFIGHVIRENKAPNSALTAWMHGKQPRGRPRCTCCSTLLEHLRKLLPDHVAPDGNVNTWTHFTIIRTKWENLIKGKISPQDFSSDRPPPPSPQQQQHYHQQHTSPSPQQSLPRSRHHQDHSSTPPPTSPQTTDEHICNDHNILSVPQHASLREITTAYRRLAREFHPDKWNPQKQLTKQECEERFKLISNAYNRTKERLRTTRTRD